MSIYFAQGKSPTGGRTLSSACYADDTSIPVSNGDGAFSAGDLIFVSEADGSETECLGEASSANASTVTVPNGLTADKSDTAIIWTPARFVEFVGNLNYELFDDEGVVVEEKAGGGWRANITRAPSSEISFSLSLMTPAERTAYKVFRAACGYASDFTFIDEERTITKVLKLTSGNHYNRLKLAGFVNYRLTLGVQATGEFV